MVGLLLASIWTWAIIVGQWLRMRRIDRENDRFERDFWKSEDIDSFYEARGRERAARRPRCSPPASPNGAARPPGKTVDRDGTRVAARRRHALGGRGGDRPARRRGSTSSPRSARSRPSSACSARSGASCAASPTSPAQQNTSLAVVAPGIAEALFATALGLFAAIPAVIAYNRFSYGINRIEARLQRFADGFHGTLCRELEVEG